MRRFIHKQYVKRLIRIRASPKPGGTCSYLATRVDCIQKCRVICSKLHVWQVLFEFLNFLNALDWSTQILCGFNHFVEHIPNDFMTICSDANPLAPFCERADDSRTDMRLSSAGRSLNWQYSTIKLRRKTHPSRQRQLVRLH